MQGGMDSGPRSFFRNPEMYNLFYEMIDMLKRQTGYVKKLHYGGI